MKVVIFGGTTEGRQLAEYLIQLNKKQKMQTIEVHVCVASEYGAQVLPEDAALSDAVFIINFYNVFNLF